MAPSEDSRFEPKMPVKPIKPIKPNDGDAEVSPLRATYNVVTDTVSGVNVRRSDNLFQAFFVSGSVGIGSLLGLILTLLIPSWRTPWIVGLMVGGFIGLTLGILLSGTMLMVYRAWRHSKGKHD